MKPTPATRRSFIAIINGEDRHPIDLGPCKDANEARRYARDHMRRVVGWDVKTDGRYKLTVRLAD